MNQKVIEVKLTVLSDIDVLIFGLDEERPEAYVVNLNSADSQNELKKVFSHLLQVLLETDIYLKYTIAPGFSKGLYKEVCKEYIDDLNRELSQVKANMEKEIN
jgi:hypothetical protein